MKGFNTLILNSATVCEALQEYLNRRKVGGDADQVIGLKPRYEGAVYEYHFNLKERVR